MVWPLMRHMLYNMPASRLKRVPTCSTLGAESSRPGAIPATLDEELERLLPVLEALDGCGADFRRYLQARGDARGHCARGVDDQRYFCTAYAGRYQCGRREAIARFA